MHQLSPWWLVRRQQHPPNQEWEKMGGAPHSSDLQPQGGTVSAHSYLMEKCRKVVPGELIGAPHPTPVPFPSMLHPACTLLLMQRW